jgi:hypothetical protein
MEFNRALSPETLLKATCDELLDAGEEELSGVGSSLEAELWASSAWRMLEPLRLLDTRVNLLLLDALGTAAERRGSENALGMLLTLSALSPADPLAGAAGRMVARGVSAPSWAVAAGRAIHVEAWLGSAPLSPAQVLSCIFDSADGPRHALGVLIDLRLAGAAKDAFVSVDLSALQAGLLDGAAGLAFEPVLPAAAADLLHRGLEAAAQLWPAGLIDDDVEDMRPLLAHRIGVLRAAEAQPAEASRLIRTAVRRRRRHPVVAGVAGEQVPLFPD